MDGTARALGGMRAKTSAVSLTVKVASTLESRAAALKLKHATWARSPRRNVSLPMTSTAVVRRSVSCFAMVVPRIEADTSTGQSPPGAAMAAWSCSIPMADMATKHIGRPDGVGQGPTRCDSTVV